MRGDHRLRRGIDDVPKRLVGNVRYINHHSQPIHLADDLFPKVVQAARLANRISGRAGPTRADAPRRRHIAHAQIVIALNVRDTLVDRIAAFQSHQRRDFAARRRAADVGRSRS